jgi:cyclase
MLYTRVMPCLLVKNRKLVKTVKFKNPAYIGDPVNAIKIYNEKEVDEIVVLDITASLEKRAPDYDFLRLIADECFMPLCYGGGVDNVDAAKKIFEIGAEKVSVNSCAAKDKNFIRSLADLFGSQSIVVSIDVKKNLFGKYQVFTLGGTEATGRDPAEYAVEMEKAGVGEIFLTSIDRDGTWEGYDINLIKKVASEVNIPIICCGGARSIKDFGKAVREGGASALAAGSMVVYQGKGLGVLINFPEKNDIERELQ